MFNPLWFDLIGGGVATLLITAHLVGRDIRRSRDKP